MIGLVSPNLKAENQVGCKSFLGNPVLVNQVRSQPKCVSSAKRASMSKSERESAQRRKRAADPNQPQKTGAAKPTYVSTDKPKKKMSESTEFVTLPLQVEIPSNIRDFNLGLMFRESLEENSGMLFIFDEAEKQSFHMTETLSLIHI